MRTVLVNGSAASPTIDVVDRGLNYGDGLFETMLFVAGKVRFLDAHLERLALGCSRLQIAFPGNELLLDEITTVSSSQHEGVIKIVVTRGSGGRGYRPDRDSRCTRIVSIHDAPPAGLPSIRARWCQTRLGRNPALAGIKHLNRLEQVLAQQEWSDASIAEGFMLDHTGELVCATSANVFIVRQGALLTPDLRHCGVRGIMRDMVIRAATRMGITVHQLPLWPDDVEAAEEVFVTNAVRGIRSIIAIDHRQWREGPLTQSLRNAVSADA